MMKFRVNRGNSFNLFGFNIFVDVGGKRIKEKKFLEGGQEYDTKDMTHKIQLDGVMRNIPVNEKEFIEELKKSNVNCKSDNPFIIFVDEPPKEVKVDIPLKQKSI